jgi:hypothetical protein
LLCSDKLPCHELLATCDLCWFRERALHRRHTPEATREALAMHIIDLAKTGVSDVNRLRDDAVAFVLDAQQRRQM